jgi:hypothetical protein
MTLSGTTQARSTNSFYGSPLARHHFDGGTTRICGACGTSPVLGNELAISLQAVHWQEVAIDSSDCSDALNRSGTPPAIYLPQ